MRRILLAFLGISQALAFWARVGDELRASEQKGWSSRATGPCYCEGKPRLVITFVGLPKVIAIESHTDTHSFVKTCTCFIVVAVGRSLDGNTSGGITFGRPQYLYPATLRG